jgi:hypothetical protein
VVGKRLSVRPVAAGPQPPDALGLGQPLGVGNGGINRGKS